MQVSMSKLVQAAGQVLAAGAVAATAMLGGHITGAEVAPAEAASSYTLTLTPPANNSGAFTWQVYAYAGYTGPTTGLCGSTDTATGNACSVTLQAGAVMNVYPVAKSTTTFRSWTGSCTGIQNLVYSTSTRCNITLMGNYTASAEFNRPVDLRISSSPDFYKVAWSNSLGASGVCDPWANDLATCRLRALEGTMFTLTPQLPFNLYVASWQGPCEGQGATCTFKLSGDTYVQARLNYAMRTLTVSPKPTGGVVRMYDDSGAMQIECGYPNGSLCSATMVLGREIVRTTVTTPNEFKFTGFGGACTGQTCALRIDSDKTVSASFVSVPVVTVDLSVDHGSIEWSGAGMVSGSCAGTCSVKMPKGAAVTFRTWKSDEQYQMRGWTTGACAGQDANNCSVTLTGDTKVWAAFRILKLF